jgi:hypothetical protein
MMYSPQFGTITSGQFTLPGGLHSYQITIQSGSASINGITFWAPQQFQGGGLDSKMLLQFGSGINIGCTGSRVNYMYL